MSTEQNKSFIDIFKEAAGEHCHAVFNVGEAWHTIAAHAPKPFVKRLVDKGWFRLRERNYLAFVDDVPINDVYQSKFLNTAVAISNQMQQNPALGGATISIQTINQEHLSGRGCPVKIVGMDQAIHLYRPSKVMSIGLRGPMHEYIRNTLLHWLNVPSSIDYVELCLFAQYLFNGQTGDTSKHCEAILYGLEEGLQVRLINLVYNHRICP